MAGNSFGSYLETIQQQKAASPRRQAVSADAPGPAERILTLLATGAKPVADLMRESAARADDFVEALDKLCRTGFVALKDVNGSKVANLTDLAVDALQLRR